MQRSTNRGTGSAGAHQRLTMAIKRMWQRDAMLHMVYQRLAGRMPDERTEILVLGLAARAARDCQHCSRWLQRLGLSEPQHIGLHTRLWGWSLSLLGLRWVLAWVDWAKQNDNNALAHILIQIAAARTSQERLQEVV